MIYNFLMRISAVRITHTHRSQIIFHLHYVYYVSISIRLITDQNCEQNSKIIVSRIGIDAFVKMKTNTDQ